MNKVSIINYSLHKKYVVENENNLIREPSFRSNNMRRKKSPEQTIKRLIKKGLLHHVNMYAPPQTSQVQGRTKENGLPMGHSVVVSAGESIKMNKMKTSNSTFSCVRNKGNISDQKHRLVTEQKQRSPSQSRYVMSKTFKADDEDFQPAGSQIFREFRNISSQSLNRLNAHNDLRNFKLSLLHKKKYDEIWWKYTLPSMTKEKNLQKNRRKNSNRT